MRLLAALFACAALASAQYYPPSGGGGGTGCSTSGTNVQRGDGSGGCTATAITSTVAGYVDPTSSIQTQLNGKAASSASTMVNGQTCALGGSCTATVPISTGVSGLGTGIATWLATPSGANLNSALTTALPVTAGGTGLTTITTNAIPKGAGTSAEVVSGVTIDSSNNISTSGGLSTGVGGSIAGFADLGAGTAHTAAGVGFQAPSTVTTPFMMTLPAAPTTGFLLSTGTSDPAAVSFVASTGTGNVVRAQSPTVDSLTVTTSCTGCGGAAVSNLGQPLGTLGSSSFVLNSTATRVTCFWQRGTVSANKIWVDVGVADAGHNYEFGFYAFNGALISNSTTVPAGLSATGVVSVSTAGSFTLNDGSHYCFAVSNTNGSGTATIVEQHDLFVDVVADTQASASTFPASIIGLSSSPSWAANGTFRAYWFSVSQ